MKWHFLIFLFIVMPNFSFAQIYGCNDLQAKNYNPNATINDGSCIYVSSKIKPYFSVRISDSIDESSGLIFWNNRLWTINDDTDTTIYSIDTTGTNLKKYAVEKVKNRDWEEISQDSSYIYIGDFGNNGSGNRKDLQILKIDKSALLENRTVVDTIKFSFDDQINFQSKTANATDYDCETLLVTRDSIYLLTKEWSRQQTKLYTLPKTSGTYQAKFKGSLNVNGLITGGVILEDKKLVALCGYSNKLQPFIYLLYDYDKTDFFSGNKRKIKLALPFHQIEGIATDDGLNYYLTNEQFRRKPFISVDQQLHKVDLSTFLKSYLEKTLSKH